jgi:dTDP-4-amino-4,6-dideoxygalactose transaminase
MEKRRSGMIQTSGRSWSVDQPVRETYLVFGSLQILRPEIDEVVATLRSGWIGTGPRVATFEAAFREYVGTGHAMAVDSCTAVLHLSLVAINLEPGDEVIVPSKTFASTANVVIHAGGTPLLACVDRETMNLDPEDAARRITLRTRAIVPAHFAGRACQMDAILASAARHGLRVIEDCAHAIEILYHGRHAGISADLGAFSFYVTKNVFTGEGGRMTTSNRPGRRASRSWLCTATAPTRGSVSRTRASSIMRSSSPGSSTT